jgi:hypothetical protein
MNLVTLELLKSDLDVQQPALGLSAAAWHHVCSLYYIQYQVKMRCYTIPTLSVKFYHKHKSCSKNVLHYRLDFF